MQTSTLCGTASQVMGGRIVGISRTSLWAAWKAIRADLSRASVRDVVDHLEYDTDPDRWINRLLRDLRLGTYEPSPPARFYLPKKKGFDRQMTMPEIPDLVLYRAIADRLYKRAKRFEHDHVYFDRRELQKKQISAASEATQTIANYGPRGSRFLTWLQYDQYRKYLIFKRIYPFVAVTDISNYFDSILFGRVSDVLLGIPLIQTSSDLYFSC
ncbi:hypothetical protein [Candidatus Binatus sp.]|uniref:hypothetical protein n=1 Tax=Candidatus Binatus sp. TaxID=2811406 RepID=UPI003C93E8F8